MLSTFPNLSFACLCAFIWFKDFTVEIKNMTDKNPYLNGSPTVLNEKNDETEWEMRPSGMLVQKREDDNGADVSTTGPMIAVSVTHGYGPTKYKIFLPAQSTFGTLFLYWFSSDLQLNSTRFNLGLCFALMSLRDLISCIECF